MKKTESPRLFSSSWGNPRRVRISTAASVSTGPWRALKVNGLGCPIVECLMAALLIVMPEIQIQVGDRLGHAQVVPSIELASTTPPRLSVPLTARESAACGAADSFHTTIDDGATDRLLSLVRPPYRRFPCPCGRQREDAHGNQTAYGPYMLAYDAESRLTSMTSTSAGNPSDSIWELYAKVPAMLGYDGSSGNAYGPVKGVR